MLFAEILSFVCLIDRTGKVLTLELSFTFSLCSSFCSVSGLKLYFLYLFIHVRLLSETGLRENHRDEKEVDNS